jgi:elongation factor Ts
MSISAADVKILRDKTNAGFMACKQALTEAGGDIEKAVVALRKQGLSVAAKKAGREASEGMISAYVHMGNKLGVMVEVSCETDFAAKNEMFIEFAKDIAMHVAARSPKYLNKEDVPQSEIDKEKDIIQAQIKNKPPNIVEKIVEGKLDKFYSENCLIHQGFVKDPDITIEEYTKQKILVIGENIIIRRFIRFSVGEEL